MTDTLTIKIPIELAKYAVAKRQLVTRYQTNQLIKALDTWLILKAEAPGSLIQTWNKQKQRLIQLAKCSETIFRHRISCLQDLKLLTFDRNNIKLCSWDHLASVLDLDLKEKKLITYNINDNAKIYQWIFATEISDNQKRQAYMVLKQVNKNPELNMILTGALIQYGADRNKLKNGSYFLSMLKSLYLADFVQASEIHDTLINIRPDTNRGVKKMAAAWNAKHPMTVSYWKKILQQSGIIDIAKIQVQSTGRIRNKHCKVLWLPGPKETLLCLCDQITVLDQLPSNKKFFA
jgi:hypothetical protein